MRHGCKRDQFYLEQKKTGENLSDSKIQADMWGDLDDVLARMQQRRSGQMQTLLAHWCRKQEKAKLMCRQRCSIPRDRKT